MFQIGDYIVFGNSGVCRVEEISKMDLTGNKEEKLYYTLLPLYVTGSKVYTPVENNKTVMRDILSKEEANELIEEIPVIEKLWIPNEKIRENTYKEALKTCDCKELIKIIKTLYLRKQERIEEGKKITSIDERYLKSAQDHLYGELAIVLEMEKNEVENYITRQVEEKIKGDSDGIGGL